MGSKPGGGLGVGPHGGIGRCPTLWDTVSHYAMTQRISRSIRSHIGVIGVTVRPGGMWHKHCIMNVGEQCLILKASDALKACLIMAGKKEHFSATNTLFWEDCDNAGVFLVVGGTACMSVKRLPRLDRLFGSGSLLGLPSSFTGRPYTLTATATTETDVMHVSREDFLLLMLERPNLCREATEMLGREMTFIQAALAERLRQAASARTPSGGVVVV